MAHRFSADEEDELQRRVRAATTSARPGARTHRAAAREGRSNRASWGSASSVNKLQRFERQGPRVWWIGVGGSRRAFRLRWSRKSLPRRVRARRACAGAARARRRRKWASRRPASVASGRTRSQAAPQAHEAVQRPQFEAKFWDVVGLYLDSMVLCCDEKTQIMERTQPGLPLKYHRGRSRCLRRCRRVIKRLEAQHTHVSPVSHARDRALLVHAHGEVLRRSPP